MRITRRKVGLGIGGIAALSAAALTVPSVSRLFHPLTVRLQGERTVADRLAEFSAARGRLADRFRSAGVAYPPARVVLLGLKDEHRLEVYAAAGPGGGPPRQVADYPIRAASGGPGPKLREGDGQVPEGVYPLESLNPNSRFHVALRVGYPNDMDRAAGRRDGRPSPGGDIMIHGGSASVGCLAMGDPAAEELFVLAADAGLTNVTVVLSPVDLRRRPLPPPLDAPDLAERYAAVRAATGELAAD